MLFLLAGLIAAGCSKNDDRSTDTPYPPIAADDADITDRFDPLFARELQKRGYIADADRIIYKEIKNITEISISGTYDNRGEVASLQGIECFTALTDLACSYNQLTSLDVSGNRALVYLSCDYNELTSLNVSANTALSSLACNYNRLATLDVSKNTALTELLCCSNELTALDLSKNTALTVLWCFSNELTALDVSRNTALTKLWCNGNRLTTLDVSRNTVLSNFACESNELTALDLSKNTELTDLTCGTCKLTSLDISHNTKLGLFECYGNPGDGAVFPVTAWFDNDSVPTGPLPDGSGYNYYFTSGSWSSGGNTVAVDYRKAK